MAVLVNLHRTKGEPLTRDDFLPHVKGEERPPADLASQVRAGGGVVMALPALISVNSSDPPAE